MRPAEEINKLIKKLNIKASANLDKRVRESLSGEHPEIQKARSNYQNSFMRRILMKNIKTKLAVAASLIVVCAILLNFVFNKTEHEIKIPIPKELASMSLTEIVKLHYNSKDTTYDPNLIKVALQQSLDKSKPEQIIQVVNNFVLKKDSGPGGGMGRGMRASSTVQPVKHLGYISKTFSEVIEKSDLFVHANLKDIDINVDDIINGLIEKEQNRYFEDHIVRYRVSLKLHIIETLPKDVLERGKIIAISTVIDEGKLNELKKNSGYYFCMTLDRNNDPHFLDYFTGIYEINFSDPANMELWPFLSDAQDILKYEQIPEQKTIDYWTSKLNGETLLLAIEYMDILPDELIPASSIMDAIDIKYAELGEQIQQNYNDDIAIGETNSDGQARSLSISNVQLFNKAMNLLVRAGDKDCISRMLALFDNDIESGKRSILWQQILLDNKLLSIIVRMKLALQEDDTNNTLFDTYFKYTEKPLTNMSAFNIPEVRRSEQLQFAKSLLNQIISCAVDTKDKNILSMLSEMLHKPSDLGIDYMTMEEIWKYLASRGTYDIRSELENILGDPAILNVSSPYYYEQAAFQVLSNLAEDIRPNEEDLVYYLLKIYKRNKDISSCRYYVVTTLQEMLNLPESECSLLLNDIIQQEESQWNIKEIMPDSENDSKTNLYDETEMSPEQEQALLTKALGILDSPYRQDKSDSVHDAIKVLARHAGKSSIPRLLEFYNTTNDIEAKANAAIGLYYNGNKTGEELIKHFVEGTHLSVPEIAMRWSHDIGDGDLFQNVINSYLRNELTDALMMEKMTIYLDRADTYIDTYFFKDYESEILHIAVDQLNNKDKTIRGYACDILRNATGMNFGFDPEMYHGRQDDIVQQWRDYLAKKYPSTD